MGPCYFCRSIKSPRVITECYVAPMYVPRPACKNVYNCDRRYQVKHARPASRKVKWRQGTKLGRTLYVNDVCIGMVDTPALAKQIVDAMNAKETLKKS